MSVVSDWKAASASIANTFPKLSSEFLSSLDSSELSPEALKRLELLAPIAAKLAGTADAPTTALLVYNGLGLVNDKRQVAVKDEFEVDTVTSLFSKLWGGSGKSAPAAAEPVDLVEVVDLTDLSDEVDAEDPFTSLDSLKELTIELISSIDTKKVSVAQWTDAIQGIWTAAVRSGTVVATPVELARFISIFVENINDEKMLSFWKEDVAQFKAMADEAKEKMDVAALLYSLELFVPIESFKNPRKWETQRYEWHHALKRFPNEGLYPVKEVIRVSFDLPLDEEGHATAGHKCITEKDKALAEADGSALLFGEFLATGVHRAFDKEHLDGSSAEVIYDFGMGLGKLMLQVYLQFPNCKTFVGVELSPSRYILGRDALRRFSTFTGGKYQKTFETETAIRVTDDEDRFIEFREQNLFDATEGLKADIIILETHFPQGIWDRLRQYLWGMKAGARLLTYENLHNVYQGRAMPFDQIPINIAPNDRFYTTWSPKRGHHFYLWKRNSLVL